jgi:retron-type reverse transcriptase
MSDKRQKNQLQMSLAFTDEGRREAPKARREGTESLTAKRRYESPAPAEQWMEEVCDRENLKQALRRGKANQGSPGVDGMKVGALPGYRKQPWPAIREQWRSGTYQPQRGSESRSPSRTEECASWGFRRCWTGLSSRR